MGEDILRTSYIAPQRNLSLQLSFMIFLFLLLYIDELLDLSLFFLLTFTMEGESELRAGDAFIAKWLITSEMFSLCY